MRGRERLSGTLDANAGAHIAFLQELVRTDTTVIDHGITGGNERAGQDLVRARMTQIGVEVDEFEPDNIRLAGLPEFNPGHAYHGRPNLVGRLPGKGSGQSLLLNGHIDTVPTGELRDWKFDPFGGEIAGGRLYGRGAVDMKAGLAGCLCALESIREAGIELDGDVILESVVDEEGGGNGTLACIERGYRADCALFAEPTELNIYRAHMGFIFLRVRVTGLARHASMKWEGINALEKAHKLVEALEELEREWLMSHRHAVLPGPTIAWTQMHGGVSGSIVPDHCELDVVAHFLPEQGDAHGLASLVEREMRDRIEALSQSDRWLREHPPDVFKYQEGSAFETEATHPFIEVLRRAAGPAGVAMPRVAGAAYGADTRLYANVAKIPSFILGPGDIRRAHGIDEYVEIDQYLAFIRLMAFAIVDWTSVRGGRPQVF